LALGAQDLKEANEIIEDDGSHRIYEKPDRPWIGEQTWDNVLFAHWPVPKQLLKPMIPEGLVIDTFDGDAFIGFIPFQISQMHLRNLPSIPGMDAFPEANVRTYVIRNGRPGVYFLSLDVGHQLAARLARRFFHLAYYFAQIDVRAEESRVHYQLQRMHPGQPMSVDCTYGPTSEVFQSKLGSIESWLTDRYCLYTSYQGELYRGEIDHAPWPLQTAEAEFQTNGVFSLYGFPVPNVAPHLHFAKHQHTHIWTLEKEL
jgi:uncharacterized protein